MLHRQSIFTRITYAFVLMTLAVSGTFSLAIFKVCHYMEKQIVSKDLDHKLVSYIHEHPDGKPSVVTDSTLSIFATNNPGNPIPEKWMYLKPGFTELVQNHQALHAYRRTIDAVDYLLTQDQSNLEIYEQALFDGVVAGFVLSVLAASIIGWLLAKKLTSPIMQLAAQVKQHDLGNPSKTSLAAKHGQDEIGQLASAFDTTLDQLNMALQRERLFTSDVSHELRSSLMIIAAASEMLINSMQNDSKSLGYVQRISTATENMRKLVQTFLVLARSKNEESHVCEKSSISAVAHAQFKKWEPSCKAKGLELSLVETQHSDQNYNEIFLDTVISNLLRNALYYTERGSIKISLEGETVSIEDTGIGISMTDQKKIFDPFVRVDHSMGDGLGIGLSLVQRICEHQGWEVSMQSISPQGSIFIVNLQKISPNFT